MFVKLLSTLYYYYKKFTTPGDYQIISEELEYKVNYDLKYLTEDSFWKRESKDWDYILDYFYVNVTGAQFRNTSVPQNVEHIILRINYYFNGRVYTVVSNNINYRVGPNEESGMKFNIPLSSAWIVDHDDKPVQNITERVRRYAGPNCDFHGQKVSLEDFLYYEPKYLEERFPKIMLTNGLGMKKIVSTTDGYTTDLRIP
jgi:anaerobic selenocysteine-containing dehydrogenase|tara:strand:- start:8179 stop:8778 length:600 start_codon:yes stop_codon:yes gene_type:complete